MATKNPKAGRGKCPSCAEPVLFRRSAVSGKLTYTCDECDSAGYADQGGKADAKWSASIASPVQAPAAPAATPLPKLTGAPDAPAPIGKPKAAAFSMGDL